MRSFDDESRLIGKWSKLNIIPIDKIKNRPFAKSESRVSLRPADKHNLLCERSRQGGYAGGSREGGSGVELKPHT